MPIRKIYSLKFLITKLQALNCFLGFYLSSLILMPKLFSLPAFKVNPKKLKTFVSLNIVHGRILRKNLMVLKSLWPAVLMEWIYLAGERNTNTDMKGLIKIVFALN